MLAQQLSETRVLGAALLDFSVNRTGRNETTEKINQHVSTMESIISALKRNRRFESGDQTIDPTNFYSAWSAYKLRIAALEDVTLAYSSRNVSYDSVTSQYGIIPGSKAVLIQEVRSTGHSFVQLAEQLHSMAIHEVDALHKQSSTEAIFFIVLVVVLLMLTMIVLETKIIAPLKKLQGITSELSKGSVSVEDHNFTAAHEIRSILKNISVVASNVENASAFAASIGSGNFGVSYNSAGEDDLLGAALSTMKEKLIAINREDKKRNWATEGLAKFAEMLRADSNLKELCESVVTSLVKYLGANQGSLFILNDDAKDNFYLELVATYAWNKKRLLQKKILFGEGLAGQAWAEGEVIYLKEIPENYVEITSGLGHANPRSLIVLPLKLNDEIFGVIELASFREYEEYERDFLIKVAENIAATLSTTKVNERTSRLLIQSQQQAEELRAQEEEVRQNMEELQATQEEVLRKNLESENRIKAIEESGIASIEFDVDGTIITANDNFLRLMAYTLPEIQRRHHRMFVNPTYAESEEYRKFWNDLSRGIARPGEYERITKSGKTVFIKGSYSIIRDATGKPQRILKLASDITSLVVQRTEVQERVTATDRRGVI